MNFNSKVSTILTKNNTIRFFNIQLIKLFILKIYIDHSLGCFSHSKKEDFFGNILFSWNHPEIRILYKKEDFLCSRKRKFHLAYGL